MKKESGMSENSQPKPEGLSKEKLVTLIEANAYRVYKAAITGWAPAGSFKWFEDIKPGDLVLETSAMGFRASEGKRLGFLREIAREPWSEEEPESLQTVYYIETVLTGEIIRWENCHFIKVHQSRWDD